MQTGNGNGVTHSEGGTVDIESLSLGDVTESRDEATSRDTDAGAAGARPKTTTKTLQRKNTPVVLPKVASLYGQCCLSACFVRCVEAQSVASCL